MRDILFIIICAGLGYIFGGLTGLAQVGSWSQHAITGIWAGAGVGVGVVAASFDLISRIMKWLERKE